LAAAGWPMRTSDSMKKLLSDTKMAITRKKSTGGAAVEWSTCFDIIIDILGKENLKICAISCGIDSSESVVIYIF
jgi:hypothetical protein